MSEVQKLFLVLAVFGILHIPVLAFPNWLVFDETIYITNAHYILDGSSNFNVGQPPLGKDILALSILYFQDNMDIGGNKVYSFAWRFPSVIFGILCLFLFYRIVEKLSVGKRLALFSTMLLSFDNFFFIHSSIGTLDIFFLFFMMLSIDLYLSNRSKLSAVSSGFALVAKFFSIFGIIIIVCYEFVNLIRRGLWGIKEWIKFSSKYLMVSTLVFVILLIALDIVSYRNPADKINYWNPLEHIRAMFDEHSGLLVTSPKTHFLLGIACNPWYWFLNPTPMHYYITRLDGWWTPMIQSSGTLYMHIFHYFLQIQYLGTYTLPIVVLGFVSLPYLAYDFYKNRSQASLFFLIWFGVCYFFWWPLALAGRIMFFYYFMPSIPAICYADIKFLNSIVPSNKRTLVILGFIMLCFVYFAWFLYPVRLINVIW